MGSSEIVGNQSVYWRFQPHTKGGAPKTLTHVAGNSPGSDEVTTGGKRAHGHDPIDPADIGVRTGHPGQYLVTCRYSTMADAVGAGAWVAPNVRPGKGGYLLTFPVPAIIRAQPDDNPPAEIMVEY